MRLLPANLSGPPDFPVDRLPPPEPSGALDNPANCPDRCSACRSPVRLSSAPAATSRHLRKIPESASCHSHLDSGNASRPATARPIPFAVPQSIRQQFFRAFLPTPPRVSPLTANPDRDPLRFSRQSTPQDRKTFPL